MKKITNIIDIYNIQIKPIITENDYQNSLKIIDSIIDYDLIEKDQKKISYRLWTLDAISTLIEKYEKKYYPISLPDPVEAIKIKMQMLNLSQKDLAKYIWWENRVSEILNKKRPLTYKMAKTLYNDFDISPEILLAY